MADASAWVRVTPIRWVVAAVLFVLGVFVIGHGVSETEPLVELACGGFVVVVALGIAATSLVRPRKWAYAALALAATLGAVQIGMTPIPTGSLGGITALFVIVLTTPWGIAALFFFALAGYADRQPPT